MAVREFSGQLDGVQEFDGLLDSELPPDQAVFGAYRTRKQKPAAAPAPVNVAPATPPAASAPSLQPGDTGTIGPIQGPAPDVRSVLSGLINSLYSGAQKTRAGMRTAVADIVGSPEAQASARREVADAQLRDTTTTPAFDTKTAAGVYGGVASALQQVPAIAAGILTRSPTVATSAMVAPLVPQQYGVYRGAGADPLKAAVGAAGYAGTEYLTERLPMGVLVNQLGKVGAAKFLSGLLAREVPGEQVATLVQDAIDKAVAEPDKTWGDYARERPDAAYQTLLATLTQGGIMGGVNSGMNALQRAEDRRVAEDSREAAIDKARNFFAPPRGVARELPADVQLDGEVPAATPEPVAAPVPAAAVVPPSAPSAMPPVPSPLEQAAPAVADIVTPETAPNQPADVVPPVLEEQARAAQGMPPQRPAAQWTDEDYIGRAETAPAATASDAKTPEIDSLLPQPSEQANDEPPVPEGMTRLYHGSAEHGRYDGPAWFSTSRQYAENYRPGAELQYVDYPTDKVNAELDPDGYGQTVDKGFTWNVELDAAEVGQRKPLLTATQEQPAAPAQPAPQPTATQNLQAAQTAAAAEDTSRAINAPAMLSDKAMQITQPTEGLRPGDVVAAGGKPFGTQAQAKAEAKNAGPGWRVARGGGGFVVRYQPASEKQIANAKRLAQKQSSVDGERDSMFAAIAKLGGLNRDEVVSKWGIDPAELKGLFGAGIKRVATGGGMSIDAMGEALAEYGYLSRDEHGKHDTRELEELFDSELRGEKHYTPQGWEQALRERQAAEYEEYLNQQDLEAAGAGNFTDEQMDALDAILGDPAQDDAVAAFLDSISEADYVQEPTAEEAAGNSAAAEAAADQAGAREADAGDAEGSGRGGTEADPETQGTDGAGERAPDFALSAETLDEARARTAREEQQRAQEKRQRQEADRKAQADAMRDDFVLTGSDREADQAAARGQEALFSRGSSRGMSVDDVRDAIAKDTFGHEVDVYATLADAPEHVRAQVPKEGAEGVEGFWDSQANRVALIAENLDTPERAVEVARHELIGHYGIENMVGEQEMIRLAKRVIAAEREGNKAIAEAAAKVDRTQPGLSPERRAREIVAVMAESGAHNSIVRRVMDAIRQFLHKIGFVKSDITDAEIAKLLRDTQAYLRDKGPERSAESGTSFSARDRVDYSQDELNFGPRQSFEVPEPGLWDNIVRAMQDNKIDLKRVQDAIRGAGNTIRERSDAYLNEELYHGRVSAQVDNLVDRRVTPLLKAVHAEGLTLAEVNRYLYARHAPERNEQLAKINPHRRHNQALSGMSNTEAAGILGAFRQEGKTEKLERIAAMVDAITKESRRRIVSSGLEAREVVDAWEGAYKNYVPLMQDMPNHGRRKVGGFDVRGQESQRSLGQSDSNVAKAAIQQDIIANVIAQAQTTIQRAEKAKVARSLLDLAREFPNDNFWRVDQPPKKRRINPDTGLVELADDPNFKAKENVLTVKENGVEHFIVFNERDERAMRLAEAMQSLDAPQLPWAIEAFGKVTRYLSQWITARNPLFWITNFARDVQGAAFNLQNTPIAGKEAKVLASIPKGMAGYWQIVRGDGGGKWAEYARQFKEDGAETGYVKGFESPAERMADLEKQVEQMKQGKADPRRLARSLVDMIDDYNNIVENGVRLAVYQTARDSGLTNRQAASLAKNITVNFNRRGSQTVFANSLYMFFNANLQGNARFLGALAKNRRAQAVAGGLVAMGFVMDAVNRALGGDDDETGKKKYDEIPDFEKERNWIFMSPSGKYVKVPLPIGPHVMVNAGRIMSEMIFKKGGSVLDKGASMTRVALDAFNPMGSPGSFSQFLLPSVVKPLAQAAENKSFAGGPVYREADDRSYAGPAYDRAFRSTGDQWKEASKLLNDVTGGDNVKPGAVDVPPEVLRLMFTSYVFPGITQTADKSLTTALDSSQGKKIEASQIPALSRFYGEAPEERAQERAFYEETKKLKQTVGQAKRYAKEGNREGMERVLTDLGDGDLAAGKKRMNEFDAAEKALLNLNKARKRIETDKTPDAEQREQLDEVEARRMKVMRRILAGSTDK